jgi:Carboxypeptidase regulatory-like domain
VTNKASRLSLRLWSLLILLLICLPAFAQYSSNVQGVVSDPAGAAINGASVQLRNSDTGVTATDTTNGSGNYRFSSLPPGNYVVTAEAKGFRKTESSFTLSTSETKGINFALPLATTQQTVTVEVTPPTVDTDDSRLQATLSSETVRDLPSANRNLWDILAVTPGVVGVGTRLAGEAPGGLPDNFGTQTPQISANGRSYTGNVVMVDGMNVTSPVQNGNIILAPIPDAVQEATLQTNSWSAEDNLGSSILIQVTTKSGTNQLHGTGRARPSFSPISKSSGRPSPARLGNSSLRTQRLYNGHKRIIPTRSERRFSPDGRLPICLAALFPKRRKPPCQRASAAQRAHLPVTFQWWTRAVSTPPNTTTPSSTTSGLTSTSRIEIAST